MTYFFDISAPDVDNIIKPVQDALNGLVYIDDRQIVLTQARKYELRLVTTLRTLFGDAMAAFAARTDFVHVLVDDAVATGNVAL